MSLFATSSLEDIPLEDVGRSSLEYQLFLAYAQRQLSSTKYRQLLESEQKSQQGSSGKEEMQEISPAGKGKANQGLPSQGVEKKKKKKFKWKQKLVPSCLKGQVEVGPRIMMRIGVPNGHIQVGVGSPGLDSSATQDDTAIALVADRLAEIVNNARICYQSRDNKVETRSLEEDGGGGSKQVSEGDHRNDKEEQIIDIIVTLLRNSGDELNKKMQQDRTFSQKFCEQMSYVFFGKVADHFVEEALLDSATDPEVDVQSARVAYAMEVIARLTAVDSHPMNLVLGFGMKYLKENFSPWIHRQVGWENAVGLPDAEEVE